MGTAPVMVGRGDERRRLGAALTRCAQGRGGLVLVSGEPGIGKSRLVEETLGGWRGDAPLRVRCVAGAGPYAALVAAGVDRLSSLDPSVATAAERVLDGLSTRAATATVLVVDDLQLADAATIGLLPDIAALGEQGALLVVGTYRSDTLPRTHVLRAARAELRRAGRLEEIALRPLTVEETEELLRGVLGSAPAPSLVRLVQERTQGVPFYVEEVTTALVESGALEDTSAGCALSSEAALPVPDSVVDAVLARTSDLRAGHRDAVDCAAVLGSRVDLVALADLVGADEVDALLESGLLLEVDEDAVFRHALVREALYRDIPWGRRRDLHRRAAEVLTRRGSRPAVVAEHWLGAHESGQARPLLLEAAEQHCRVHAYRDAFDLLERALDHWPEPEPTAEQTRTMVRLAECAELCGATRQAVRTWEAVAARQEEVRADREAGEAHRRAANGAELLGDVARALASREAAARAFLRAGADGDAAAEQLALAETSKAAGRLSDALGHAEAATAGAARAGRTDVHARALGLEGAVRSALGEGARGVELARSGLALALDHQLQGVMGPAYYELAEALEYAADYARATHAYESAFEVCRAEGLGELAQVCFACMSPVMRLMGEWDRTLTVCGEVLDEPTSNEMARRVAEEESGLILALRGDARRARGRLRRAAAFGAASGVVGLEVGALWGLVLVARLEGREDSVDHRLGLLLELLRHTEECHYSLPALRWAATAYAEQGDRAGVAECHRTVAGLATRNGSAKVLSALAHVGGELAMVEGDRPRAAADFGRAVELLEGVTAPYERSETLLRWGVAGADTDREGAVTQVSRAYRTARRLGARPLAERCAEALTSMGAPVDPRGNRTAGGSFPAPLTRREREVLAQLATGRTNREIAEALFLSPRTVDMHVRNVLAKLGCTSRTAAVLKAAAHGLLPSQT